MTNEYVKTHSHVKLNIFSKLCQSVQTVCSKYMHLWEIPTLWEVQEDFHQSGSPLPKQIHYNDEQVKFLYIRMSMAKTMA